MSGPLYVEHLGYLAEVTKMLNELAPKLPDADGYYLHVELRDETGRTLGHWSDEIADDCWAFELSAPKEDQ